MAETHERGKIDSNESKMVISASPSFPHFVNNVFQVSNGRFIRKSKTVISINLMRHSIKCGMLHL